MKVCVDAGHGGHDPGARGPKGLKEAGVNLQIATLLARILEGRGHDVRLTRSDDSYLELPERAEVGNRFKANLFVSIHCNGATNASAGGLEVWTTKGQDKSDPVAEAIFLRMAQLKPTLRMRADLTDGDHDKEANYAVLRHSKSPAVLVECGFITNSAEEALLGTPEFRKKMAIAIADGIADSMGG